MRVAVIPTGVMEQRGLASALRRLFPGHEFYSLLEREARPGVEGAVYNQSNTNRVSVAQEKDDYKNGKTSNRTKLVRALAGAVFPPGPKAADLAIALDDLELCNLDQPAAVVFATRAAVECHLEEQRQLLKNPRDVQELATCLRERASFHFAVPMTEAWVFADPRGPSNSGVPASEQVRLKSGIDPEEFETDDPAYSADTGAQCAQMQDRNRRRKENRKPPWLLSQQSYPIWRREYNPKAYLQWLCRDPQENWCTCWRESKEGADALTKLDWAAALSMPSHCAWLRAMIDDLAEALGEVPPFPLGIGESCALTAHRQNDPNAVLRNL